MSPLFKFEGKIIQREGKLGNSRNCCCGCRTDQLGDVEVELTADHGCNCAKFKFYVNDKFIKNVDLNNADNPGTATDKFNANISQGAKVDGQCCLITLKLACNVNPEDDSGLGGPCSEAFGDPPCHTNITQAQITLKNGKVIVAGILPDDLETPVRICPDDLEEQAANNILFTTQTESSSSSTSQSSCPCCNKNKEQQDRIAISPLSGLGDVLMQLLSSRRFSKLIHIPTNDPQFYKLIRTANLVTIDAWSRHPQTIVDILRNVSSRNHLPFNEDLAKLLVRRAITMCKNNIANQK